MLDVTLITRGSPDQLTGGHLYQRNLARLAAQFDADVRFATTHGLRNPLRRTTDVNVVDSIAAWAVAPWAVLARRGPPLAAIVHQPPGGVDDGRLRRRAQETLDRGLYRRCARVIAVSASLAGELVDLHHLPAERVEAIEPGIDLDVAHARRCDLRRGRGAALLCVANWLPNKGVLQLLEALAVLPAETATLHLVGRDDVDVAYTNRVRARLRQPDVRDRVVVHGAVERTRLAELYTNADVFVLASAAETYGMVYAEALTAGLPIIGWRRGHLVQMIVDGREGRLLPPGDIGALAGALLTLSTDTATRASMGAAASRRAASLPSWEAAAERFFSVLRRLSVADG